MPKRRPPRIFLAAILAAAWLPGPAALAYCFPPSHYGHAPVAPTHLAQPKPPDCLSGGGYIRKHDCARWEYNSYVNAMNTYIRQVSAYADAARGFAARAAAFADAAADYADCATRDARREID
ncbi:MAG: hypothetical protein WD767_09330 [Alphaproteobacteria bacterium]